MIYHIKKMFTPGQSLIKLIILAAASSKTFLGETDRVILVCVCALLRVYRNEEHNNY